MPEVNYKVVISREGNGAAVAAAELQSLAQSATGANASLNTMNSAAVTGSANTMQAFGRMNQQTAVMVNTFKALDGTLRIIGFSTFPQITMAVTTAVDGMRALTNAARIAAVESAKAATASAGGNIVGGAIGGKLGGKVGTEFLESAAGGAAGAAAAARAPSLLAGAGAIARVAGPIAVIATSLYDIGKRVYGIYAYDKALNQLDQSMKNGEEQANQTADAIRKMAEGRIESGDLNLTPEAADAIDRLLTLGDSRGAIAAIDANTRPAFFMTEAQKAADARRRLGMIDRDRAVADSVAALENPNDLSTSSKKEDARNTAWRRYSEDLKNYNQLLKEGMITQEQSDDLSAQSAIAQNERLLQIKSSFTEMQQMGQRVVLEFASGFSNAFVSFLDGTKSAKEAFSDFARSFLSDIARMIMQQLILNAIKSTGWGKALFSAEGGMYPRMMAAGGMQGVVDVSSPTYFPKFNVLAGEAGREMMTVLARPRMMEVGGMQAVVGSAQGQQLAITSADQLAERRGGGVVDIRVTLGPELRAEIVNQSIEGARVTVAQDMRQDTPISRGVKGLTA